MLQQHIHHQESGKQPKEDAATEYHRCLRVRISFPFSSRIGIFCRFGLLELRRPVAVTVWVTFSVCMPSIAKPKAGKWKYPAPTKGQPAVSEPEKVFDMVEQMPTFPGGQQELMSYLGKNIKYPTIAQENGQSA